METAAIIIQAIINVILAIKYLRSEKERKLAEEQKTMLRNQLETIHNNAINKRSNEDDLPHYYGPGFEPKSYCTTHNPIAYGKSTGKAKTSP